MALAGVAHCIYLVIALPDPTHVLLLLWVVAALMLHFGYSFPNSAVSS